MFRQALQFFKPCYCFRGCSLCSSVGYRGPSVLRPSSATEHAIGQSDASIPSHLLPSLVVLSSSPVCLSYQALGATIINTQSVQHQLHHRKSWFSLQTAEAMYKLLAVPMAISRRVFTAMTRALQPLRNIKLPVSARDQFQLV